MEVRVMAVAGVISIYSILFLQGWCIGTRSSVVCLWGGNVEREQKERSGDPNNASERRILSKSQSKGKQVGIVAPQVPKQQRRRP
jgi:hypothetical protein